MFTKENSANTCTVSDPELSFVASHSSTASKFVFCILKKHQRFTQTVKCLYISILCIYIFIYYWYIFLYSCVCLHVYVCFCICVYMYKIFMQMYVFWLFKIEIIMDQEYPERLKSELKCRWQSSEAKSSFYVVTCISRNP